MDINKKKKELIQIISLFLSHKKSLQDLQGFAWDVIDWFVEHRNDTLPTVQENEGVFWYVIWQMQHLANKEHENDGTLLRELRNSLDYLLNRLPCPKEKFGTRP